ncbi:MAG: metal-dependent transcriptional regulator [Spirochaetales bacterium]|nr:metal-dependent transcriptional regulator [Spirochaetales bacterium]
MKKPATATEEDYVKSLLELELKTGSPLIPMGLLARSLGLTAGTITTMVKRLDSSGLAIYQARKGCQLTSKGRNTALQMLRRHRVIETFLVQELGFGWENVHMEAEAMEHGCSDAVVNRLWEYIGKPQRDPHGAPIPDTNLVLPPGISDQGLDEIPQNTPVQITQISDRNPELLQLLDQIAIQPNTIAVKNKKTLKGPKGEVEVKEEYWPYLRAIVIKNNPGYNKS